MGIEHVIQGVLVGVLVSAPVGPIGVLCIQKTINKGRIAGYVSGLGATTADTVYAIIAGFGLSFITNFLADQEFYVRIIGGIILVAFGVNMFFTDTVKQIKAQRLGKNKKLFGDYIAVFFLTISNPLTILAFGIFFAGLGFTADESSLISVAYLVIGVFLGALIWWVSLVTIINLLRNSFRLRRLIFINKVFGIAIVVFGVIAIISVFFKWTAVG